MEGTAQVLANQANSRSFAFGFGNSLQINDGQLCRHERMNDLPGLTCFSFESRTPRFVTLDYLIESPFQSNYIQGTEHAEIDALVVEWRDTLDSPISTRQLFLRPRDRSDAPPRPAAPLFCSERTRYPPLY